MRSVDWIEGVIVIVDQTMLPSRFERRTIRTTGELAEAITSMRVRGAPALGITGALGVAQAAFTGGLAGAEDASRILKATRPTAINLAWAIDRCLEAGRAAAAHATQTETAQRILEEAFMIQAEDEQACAAMGKHALEFFRPGSTVLTHCNTGSLCTGGHGTALGAIRHAHESGMPLRVLATETRPLLQGARLTTWELGMLGIEHALIVDGAGPGLIARGEVALVLTGADRIAANGDVANKIGTYGLALAAKANDVPFVVVAPTSTVDVSTPDGRSIEVEERGGDEVTSVLGVSTAPAGTTARNPAFDITPAALVTAIVTEEGIVRAPYRTALRRLSRAVARSKPAP